MLTTWTVEVPEALRPSWWDMVLDGAGGTRSRVWRKETIKDEGCTSGNGSLRGLGQHPCWEKPQKLPICTNKTLIRRKQRHVTQKATVGHVLGENRNWGLKPNLRPLLYKVMIFPKSFRELEKLSKAPHTDWGGREFSRGESSPTGKYVSTWAYQAFNLHFKKLQLREIVNRKSTSPSLNIFNSMKGIWDDYCL